MGSMMGKIGEQSVGNIQAPWGTWSTLISQINSPIKTVHQKPNLRNFYRLQIPLMFLASLGITALVGSTVPAQAQTVPLQVQRRGTQPTLNEQLAVRINNGTRGEFRDRADQLLFRGNDLEQSGAYDLALTTWQQALEIYQGIGDDEAAGWVMDLIGLTYGNLGQYPEAEHFLRQRLAIARDRQDFYGQVFALNNLGTILLQTAQLSVADPLFEEAYTIAQHLDYAEGKGLSLSNLGLVAAGQGQYDRALAFYEAAWLARRQGDYEIGEANTLNNLADTYQTLSLPRVAMGIYGRAEHLARLNNDPRNHFRALDGLINTYRAAGLRTPAQDLLLTRLRLAQIQANSLQELASLRSLAQFYQAQGDRTTAINFYQRAIVFAEQLHDRRQVVLLRDQLNRVAAGLPLPETAQTQPVPSGGSRLETGITILE